jgi:hypothetical protein
MMLSKSLWSPRIQNQGWHLAVLPSFPHHSPSPSNRPLLSNHSGVKERGRYGKRHIPRITDRPLLSAYVRSRPGCQSARRHNWPGWLSLTRDSWTLSIFRRLIDRRRSLKLAGSLPVLSSLLSIEALPNPTPILCNWDLRFTDGLLCQRLASTCNRHVGRRQRHGRI